MGYNAGTVKILKMYLEVYFVVVSLTSLPQLLPSIVLALHCASLTSSKYHM